MFKQQPIITTLCLALAAATILAGCANRVIDPAYAGIAGEYALISVNGHTLPATISHGGVPLQVRSGDFTIHANGSCNSRTLFVPPGGREVRREVDATYELNGAELTMRWTGAGITTGSVEGNTFSMNNEGMVLVYHKRP